MTTAVPPEEYPAAPPIPSSGFLVVLSPTQWNGLIAYLQWLGGYVLNLIVWQSSESTRSRTSFQADMARLIIEMRDAQHSDMAAIQANLQDLIVQSLTPMITALENLMTQDAELSAAVGRNTAVTAEFAAALPALNAAIQAQIAATQALRDQVLQLGQPNAAVTQAIADVNAASDALTSARTQIGTSTTALGADDEPATP